MPASRQLLGVTAIAAVGEVNRITKLKTGILATKSKYWIFDVA
jgi:hypothetical protein